jgi:NAD(P)-dependent dehydrogenase (short-subunit alcohol dehydrogenase family)
VNPFDLKGKTAVVVGGAGVLGSGMAMGLCRAGASLAMVDKRNCDAVVQKFRHEGMQATGYSADAMSRKSLEECSQAVHADFKTVDILLSCVGGNQKDATTSLELSFFDLPNDALEKVVALNLFAGAILPAQVFGRQMAKNPAGGSIINVSSMSAFQPLSRIAGYSAAKAAVSNFTQWLAVHMAREYNKNLRVNAIAPGFFLTEQNRFLLTQQDGSMTDRGKAILARTPMERFGVPEDLEGACVWLASDASRFVTGIVLPVDGGFSADPGV